MADLYVDVNREIDDDYCRTSVYGAVTLFVFKFCQVNQNLSLHFVTVRLVQRCSVGGVMIMTLETWSNSQPYNNSGQSVRTDASVTKQYNVLLIIGHIDNPRVH